MPTIPAEPGLPVRENSISTEKAHQQKNGDQTYMAKEVLDAQTALPNSHASFRDVFRYTSQTEWSLLVVSIICAIAAGAIVPCFPLLFGDMAALFQAIVLGTVSQAAFYDELSQKSLYLVYLGIGEFFATYISTTGFMYFGERTTRKLRQQYFRALLRQDIAFLDDHTPGKLSSRLAHDCHMIQEGISEKSAFTITAIGTILAAYIISFVRSWRLTLVASSILVVCVITGAFSTRNIIRFTRASMAANTIAGGLADEVLRTIRTVKILGAQDSFSKRYDAELQTGGVSGRKGQMVAAVMVAVLMTTTFWSHSLTFWTGSIFIASGLASLRDVITVAFAVLLAAHSLGMVAPHVRALSGAVAGASNVLSLIDRPVFLDTTSPGGERLSRTRGSLSIQCLSHIYPSRPDNLVLDGISMEIPAQKMTALVGHTGSGKSSVINLIQRLYPPIAGKILLDGHDISTLNLRWYREQIGVVSQEPTLTGDTIYESILHGVPSPPTTDEVARAKVIAAAKESNAHDFIMDLPEGYSTKTGEGGTQLSVGQKQRIAIARALVRDPAILIFDEATSAVDTRSERLIQVALQQASRGRTLIVIAHRLSTIKSADNIIVMSKGKIVEQGTHRELVQQAGEYTAFVKAQETESADEGNVTSSADELDDFSEKERLLQQVQELKFHQPGSHNGQPSFWALTKLTASFNQPEQRYMFLGLIFSILAGCCNPALAFVLAKGIAALSQSATTMAMLRSDASFWSLMMFVVGIACLITNVSHGLIFAHCSEKLIFRARSQTFRSLLGRDVAFFDRDNRVGSLTHTLSVEAKNLAGLSGATLGTILSTATMLTAAIIISLVVGWKVALVCGATIPIILGCGYYRVRMIGMFAQRMHNAHQASSAFASASAYSMRTIVSLSREDATAREYESQLLRQEKSAVNSIMKTSTPFAAAKSFIFFCVALAFWYGGTRVAAGEYSIFQFFLCFAEIIFAAQSAAFVFSSASDIGKARKAAKVFHDLLHHQPTIEQTNLDRKQGTLRGSIDFDNVDFTYPNRPEKVVLSGLNLHAGQGRFIALVGASGCGKSTVLSLLVRHYDPDAGQVLIDGQKLRLLDVHQYRQHLGYVGQEPVLYQGTIRDNLVLGTRSDGPAVTEDELVSVCKDANIYEFIQSLEEGFATTVGTRGVMLSGGQKQRIAIARALVRGPRILILDEATSALDTVSEKLVQDALQKASHGRTIVAVAHRLSSIRHADSIMVVDQGHIVEQGTHAELMSRKGRYYALAKPQGMD